MKEMIYKQDALDAIMEYCPDDDGSVSKDGDIRELLDDVEDLPSTERTGYWNMHSDYADRLICSECGAQFDCWHWESKQMHYCPNCGAKMEVEHERNDL